MRSKKYILLIDSKTEVLSLQEVTLGTFYKGEVQTCTDVHEAEKIIRAKGPPEAIVIDSFLISVDDSAFYKFLQTEKVNVPLIATMALPDDTILPRYPSVTSLLEKPINTHVFTYLVKSLVQLPTVKPSHIPVKVVLLLRIGMTHFDLYLKLSEANYVKILHKGEPFLESDAKRFSEKGIHELFIREDESKGLIETLEKGLFLESKTTDEIAFSVENLESFERVAKYMNWTPEVMASAHKSVNHAVKILSKNQNVLAVLKKRMSEPNSPYSRHIGLLTYLVCAFGSSIAFIGESGQVKLALAALIHDVAVEDHYYENIREWNKRASNQDDKTPETMKYRMHPYEGSKIVKAYDTVSVDVDQIILQHHEVKDGSGFPRGLDYTRIGHLPAVFIMVEDLVEFISSSPDIDKSFQNFISWGKSYYDVGHFKKIFQTFEETFKES